MLLQVREVRPLLALSCLPQGARPPEGLRAWEAQRQVCGGFSQLPVGWAEVPLAGAAEVALSTELAAPGGLVAAEAAGGEGREAHR